MTITKSCWKSYQQNRGMSKGAFVIKILRSVFRCWDNFLDNNDRESFSETRKGELILLIYTSLMISIEWQIHSVFETNGPNNIYLIDFKNVDAATAMQNVTFSKQI